MLVKRSDMFFSNIHIFLKTIPTNSLIYTSHSVLDLQWLYTTQNVCLSDDLQFKNSRTVLVSKLNELEENHF